MQNFPRQAYIGIHNLQSHDRGNYNPINEQHLEVGPVAFREQWNPNLRRATMGRVRYKGMLQRCYGGL